MKDLTPAQRRFLVLAAEQPDGNPWPKMPMTGGGAAMRMAERLVERGLMKHHNEISEAGREAVRGDVARRRELRKPQRLTGRWMQ